METFPMTINRAATAVVRARTCLERAQEGIELALTILAAGQGSEASIHVDSPERLALVERLESCLGRVQVAREVAETAWKGAGPLSLPPALEGDV